MASGHRVPRHGPLRPATRVLLGGFLPLADLFLPRISQPSNFHHFFFFYCYFFGAFLARKGMRESVGFPFTWWSWAEQEQPLGCW